MKFLALLVVVFCFLCTVDAQTTPVQFQSGSLCDRYTNALASVVGGNQTSLVAETNLITAIISRIILGGSANGVVVPGLIAPGSPILPVFQGAVPFRANPTNYTDPSQSAALARLQSHLVTFFGTAFGCTAPGFPVPPSYITMRRVHSGMGITAAGFSYFITQAGLTLESFGVDPLDIHTIAVPFLNGFGLCGGDNQICEDVECPLATHTFDEECVFQSEHLRSGVTDNTAQIEAYTMVTGAVVVVALFALEVTAEWCWRTFQYRKI
jgi:hypothetical protein